MAETEHNNLSNDNKVESYMQKDINNYVNNKYNFEIELSTCQKIIIIFLNIFTGGIGTILVPFLNKKKTRKTMIFAGILIGLLEILHFLNLFSILLEVKYIQQFYDCISDDNFLKLFFETKDNNNVLNENDNENDNDSSVLGVVIDSLKLNLNETIPKSERIKWIKRLFIILSGMSYCSSIFVASVNFINAKPDSPNYKLGLKIFFLNFFNPGTGIILSCFSLFPSCDCSNDNYNIKGIVLSILGIIMGIIIMVCPISLCIGTYLVKLTNDIMTIFPVKITFIFIGITGTFISFILSGVNKKTIINSFKFNIRPLDIIVGCGSDLIYLASNFGCASFTRLVLNIICPGLGTLTLLIKYGCSFFLFLTAIIQSIGGFSFFIILFTYIKGGKIGGDLFSTVLETTSKTPEDYKTVFNYFYTMGLCFYFSGILIILVLDYMDKVEITPYISSFCFIVLTILTGGLGFTLFLPAFIVYFRIDRWGGNYSCFFLLLFPFGGFITYGGFMYDLFFWKIVTKAYRIAFPICYCICICLFQVVKTIYNNLHL